MKIGLIIDSDWFFGKMEKKSNINWKDTNTWVKLLSPRLLESSDAEIDFVCPILINTFAKDEDDRTKGEKFEEAAKKAGFDILHRKAKPRESSARSGYRGGSLALLGASIEALASHVDSLVVHSTGLETLEILEFVMAEHKRFKTVLFSNIDTEEVPEDIKERTVLMPIDNGEFLDFLESNNGSNISTVEIIRLNELFSSIPPKVDRLGKVLDVGNVYGMEQRVGCRGGSMFKAKPLRNAIVHSRMAYSIVSFSNEYSTGNRSRQADHWEDAGWDIVRAAFDSKSRRQLDDGLVGACMSRCSFKCDKVMLIGSDIDFEPVGKFLSEIHGTHMIRVAPSVTNSRDNVTSPEVVESDFYEFIPLRHFLADHDGIVNVPGRLRPARPRNNDAIKIWREKCREIENDERDKFVRILERTAAD